LARIEALTPEQAARMAEFRDRWIQIGLSTAPAERARAEAAIAEAYKAAKLPPPQRIVWCGSPLSQGLTRAIVLQGPTKIGDSVGASVRDSVRDSVGDSVWDSVRASVGDSVWDSVRDSVGASVGASVRDSVGASVGASVYGQHDANWFAFYDYFREVTDLREQTAPLLGLTELAKAAGWCVPHANICWVSERHNVLMRDGAGQLHNVAGPAVMYPDGWGIYAVHGVCVPAEWIEKKDKLDAKTALTWQNIEQRRAAAEILGWDRILRELQPRVIDTDPDPKIGTLLEVDLPDSPKERFLRVRCGTGRDFALPVPPQMQSAAEANAWTYGLDAKSLRMYEVRT
jgi:hypothetical protein